MNGAQYITATLSSLHMLRDIAAGHKKSKCIPMRRAKAAADKMPKQSGKLAMIIAQSLKDRELRIHRMRHADRTTRTKQSTVHRDGESGE